MGKSKQKSMLVSIFDPHGVIHKEFAPLRQTVNEVFYVEVHTKIQKRIVRVHLFIAFRGGKFFGQHKLATPDFSIPKNKIDTQGESVNVVQHAVTRELNSILV